MNTTGKYPFHTFGKALVCIVFAFTSLFAQSQGNPLYENTEMQATGSHLLCSPSNDVTRTIKGRIVSQYDHAPLAGVLVKSVSSEGYSTLTGDDGTFTLEVPSFCSAIEASTPGYNRQRVGINKSGKLRDIVMQSENFKSFNDYTEDNILQTASASDFDFSHAINIASEIGHQMGADVLTTERGGLSGIGSFMHIDGITSLEVSTQPLIVIDGVITEMQYSREMIHSGFYNDVLSNFNVYDIEKVEVMRNGTSLYGAKAAGGVILIKTKRSKSLATRIDAFASMGIEMEPRNYSVMNGAQFKSYASDLLASTGTKKNSFKFLEANPEYYWYNKYDNNTNWSEYVYQPALRQRYGLTVQGGGDVAKYMLSIGYNHSDETIQEGKYNRLNVRFNTDICLTNNIDVRFDASFANTTRKIYDTGAATDYDNSTITSLNFLAVAKTPMLSPYSFIAADDGPGIVSDHHLDTDAEDYLLEVSQLKNDNYQLANPSAILYYGTAPNKNYFDNSLINLTMEPSWHPNKSLRVSSLFSYNLVNTNEKRYIPMSGVPPFYVAELQQTMNNMIGSLYSKQNSIFSDTKAHWSNYFGGHDLDFTGGVRYINEGYVLTEQVGYNTGNDKTPLISNTTQKSISGNHEKWVTLSWYGEAKYNYANRYYAQGDLSLETNSQFGRKANGGLKMAGVVWGVFPSIQTGWVVSNEEWFDVNDINYLRINVGYNHTGNDDLPYDASKSYFSSQLYLNNIPGISLENIGNTSLKWEDTRKLNVGGDAKFFNNRLETGFNAFKSWISDLLTLHALYFLTGNAQNWSNGGTMENVGMIFKTNVHIIAGNKWNWNVGTTIGCYRNTLTSLPDVDYLDTQVLGGTVRSQVGRSVNSFYGLQTGFTNNGTCVFATTEEAKEEGLFRLADDGVTKNYFEAGDVKYVDQNGDNCINEKDFVFIGDATPNAYGNIFTSLSYRNIRFDVGVKYCLGGDIYNYTRQQLESGSRFMNQTTVMLSRWRYEGQVTDIPRATYKDPIGNSEFSNRWIEDGSYLKLKNITLSYRLPINSTFIQGITAWAQCSNVFTLTNYLGTDPEVSISNDVLFKGVDCGWLSQGRMFHVGLKINL